MFQKFSSQDLLKASFALFIGTFSFSSVAQESKKEEKKADPVNFNAKDVWNVDIYKEDDHKVLVIHDRLFTKSKRIEVGLGFGTIYSDPFYNSLSMGGHLAYHFSEYWALQVFGNYSKTWFTPEANRLNDYFEKNDFNSSSEYHRPLLLTGIAAEWSPMYGKFALFRSNIIYFDVFASIGVAASQHEIHYEINKNVSEDVVIPVQGKKEWNFGSELSLGGRFFIDNNLSLKAEVKNSIYKPKFYVLGEFDTDGDKITYPLAGSKRVWRNQTQIFFSINFLFGKGGE